MHLCDRKYALDVFRGFTVAAMILVNTPGSWEHRYSALKHASWNGWTPTDLVFPFFLFAVGMSMWFSLKKYGYRISRAVSKKIMLRSVLLFAVGLILNLLIMVARGGDHFRLMGVLQRIALSYCFASFAVLLLRKRNLVLLSAVVLVGYWFVLWFWGGVSPYDLESNLVRKLDLVLLGERLLYAGEGIPFDPEGLLSTLPAVVSVLAGFWSANWLNKKSEEKNIVIKPVLLGLVLVVGGMVWNGTFPINKKIWSSSFVVFSTGVALLFLAFCIWLVDVRQQKRLVFPFLLLGRNPLFLYVSSCVWAIGLSWIRYGDGSVYGHLYSTLCVPVAGKVLGSLLFAVFHVLLFCVVGNELYRRKMFLKL